ncbi:MAG: 50S ribosomal protein L3 [Fibrobacterota bacterium]
MSSIIGKKLGMTRIFMENGAAVPVTVIEAGSGVVLQVKDLDKDGYESLKVGYYEKREKLVNKPEAGGFKKAGTAARKVIKETPVPDGSELKAGDGYSLSEMGDIRKIAVRGISKGRGFAGTVKRHGFQRGKATHGNKNYRRPGSIGQCAYPARVFPGKRMAGRMGGKNVTVRNLDVVKVDVEKNLILVKGAVPGPKNGILHITKTA